MQHSHHPSLVSPKLLYELAIPQEEELLSLCSIHVLSLITVIIVLVQFHCFSCSRKISSFLDPYSST